MRNCSAVKILFLIFYLGFFSCSDKDVEVSVIATCDDGLMNGTETGVDCGGSCLSVCPPVNAISGEIVGTLVLHANEVYILKGPLLIRDGGQLIIQQGVTIQSEIGADKYIAIAQGGRIFVYGSENNPVVFTSKSANPSPGDWGGLVICGQAPLNTGTQDRSELLDIFYGGNSPNDSSGLIQYLRVEYAGAQYDDNVNFNGITFYGVGSFTSVSKVQGFSNNGSHFEIVGGTLKADELIGINGSQGITIKDGWNGELSEIFLANNSLSALDIQNNESNPLIIPITSGIIKNLSITGSHSNGAMVLNNGGGNIHLSNIYTSGLRLGINVQGNASINLLDNNQFLINNVEFDNTLTNFSITNYTGSNTTFYTLDFASGADNRELQPTWAINWSVGFN